MNTFAAPNFGDKNLQPCLAELLRTCVHPPSLVLKVEHVFPVTASDPNRRSAVATIGQDQGQDITHNDHESEIGVQQSTSNPLKLALSDGHLQIQAVLATKLHTKELLELRRGDLLELKKFQVRSAPRVNGRGKVVYLGVEACEWAGSIIKEVDEDLGGGFIPEEDYEQVVAADSFPSSRTFLGRASETTSIVQTRHEDEDRAMSTSKRASESKTDASNRLNINRKRAREPQDKASSLSNRSNRAPEHPPSKSRTTSRPTVRFATPTKDLDDSSSDDDDFETILTSPSTVQHRRESLRHVSQHTPNSTVPDKISQLLDGEASGGVLIEDMPTLPENVIAISGERDPRSDVALLPSSVPYHAHNDVAEASSSLAAKASPPRFINPTPTPNANPRLRAPAPLPSSAPLHTLSTLLHSHALPRRNYPCSVFGLITWISPSLIHKPNSPFPPKRHIKIHDPSISSRRVGVTVAIYVDAKEFLPEVGTVALFRGVTMQRWEGEVILNAYANLKDCGEEWFVTGEDALEEMGHDVKGLRRWWAEWTGGKAPPLGSIK